MEFESIVDDKMAYADWLKDDYDIVEMVGLMLRECGVVVPDEFLDDLEASGGKYVMALLVAHNISFDQDDADWIEHCKERSNVTD